MVLAFSFKVFILLLYDLFKYRLSYLTNLSHTIWTSNPDPTKQDNIEVAILLIYIYKLFAFLLDDDLSNPQKAYSNHPINFLKERIKY